MPTTYIAVLLEGLDETHKALLSGLKRYRDRQNLDWHVHIIGSNQTADVPKGAYWVLRSPSLLAHVPIQQAGSQACTLLGTHTRLNRSCCRFDEARFGQLAAQHLHDRGYRQSATVDIRSQMNFEERRQGFADRCHELGMVYEHYIRNTAIAPADSDRQLITWLRSRPGPVAIYAAIDGQAVWLREVLTAHGLRIPAEVAVLGTGNHCYPCLKREPELSSVAYPWGLMGEAAGLHLHHQIQGNEPPPPQLILPCHVVPRASTAATHVNDPIVAKALDWLARHLDAHKPIEALIRATGISNPTLCRHFKAALGTGPKQEHDRLRIEHAMQLLIKGQLSIAAIAKKTGFRDSTAFGVTFRRRHGCSPSQWVAAQG